MGTRTTLLALAFATAVGCGATGLDDHDPWMRHEYARAMYGDAAAITIEAFYEELAPYGQWIEDSRLGYVFVPHDPSYRPFRNGHWGQSDRGLVWVSYDAVGWAVCHYGAWTIMDDGRWAWVPGTRWSPAQVDWRASDRFVGWAPKLDGTATAPASIWIFVEIDGLLSQALPSAYVPPARAQGVYRASTTLGAPSATGTGALWFGPPLAWLAGRVPGYASAPPPPRRLGPPIAGTSRSGYWPRSAPRRATQTLPPPSQGRSGPRVLATPGSGVVHATPGGSGAPAPSGSGSRVVHAAGGSGSGGSVSVVHATPAGAGAATASSSGSRVVRATGGSGSGGSGSGGSVSVVHATPAGAGAATVSGSGSRVVHAAGGSVSSGTVSDSSVVHATPARLGEAPTSGSGSAVHATPPPASSSPATRTYGYVHVDPASPVSTTVSTTPPMPIRPETAQRVPPPRIEPAPAHVPTPAAPAPAIYAGDAPHRIVASPGATPAPNRSRTWTAQAPPRATFGSAAQPHGSVAVTRAGGSAAPSRSYGTVAPSRVVQAVPSRSYGTVAPRVHPAPSRSYGTVAPPRGIVHAAPAPGVLHVSPARVYAPPAAVRVAPAGMVHATPGPRVPAR